MIYVPQVRSDVRQKQIPDYIIRSENPEKPAKSFQVPSTSEKFMYLDISGDWWEIKDLQVTNAQKGIILANSQLTQRLLNCEVYK